jgi:hypothetical protein
MDKHCASYFQGKDAQDARAKEGSEPVDRDPRSQIPNPKLVGEQESEPVGMEKEKPSLFKRLVEFARSL